MEVISRATRKLIEIFVDGLFMTTSKVPLVVNPLQPSMSSFILFSECIVINGTAITQLWITCTRNI